MVSPVSGLFEVLAAAAVIAEPDADRSAMRHFEPEIVGLSTGPMQGSSGLPLTVHRTIDEVESTDVVVIPSMAMTATGDWVTGRYPGIVQWIRRMHEGGATVCSACSGGLLMAETPPRRPRGDRPLGLGDTVPDATPEGLVAHG